MTSADRDALEALFQSTSREGWRSRAKWGTDADLSTWQGVRVDEDGSVVKVVLRNNLQGPLPEALGAITTLTSLKLGNNRLTGPLPQALGALTNLTHLELSNNQLTGPIPEVLGALAQLTKLDLHRNQLTGSIPDALGALTNLLTLDFANNQLTGPIPATLGALTKLSQLRLGFNQISGPIPDALGALIKLTKLLLHNNQLAGSIPEALGALTKLTDLVLVGNQLTGTVPLSVWEIPHTTTVDLSVNLLTCVTDPAAKGASTSVVLGCMERLERKRPAKLFPSAGLVTAGNPWEFPPAAVVVDGLESIRKYYDTWEQCDFNLVEIHALKVVFVGAYGAGKTSLARSIKMGRGDRTPEVDENARTTVGVDLHSHNLRNGTECKIYDVAGQITYYGLHHFFLTERAVYVIVLDATRFEGLRGKRLDEAIEDNILEWVSLLHMRTPLCTVMLVASHYDMLHGSPKENEELLLTVERRFLELHKKWKSLRHRQNSNIDKRMTVLPGVFPVGCKLASESSSHTAGDGLQAVDDALSKQTMVASRVPPSWVAARHVLEQVGRAHDGSADDTAVGDCRRPWELRSVIHSAFKSFVEEGRRQPAQEGGGQQQSASSLSCLNEDGIRHSMDGAIELRAFSGTVISHDVFVVLDVMWLAGVLKPILDHRGVTKNEMGDVVFADRVLGTSGLIRWASDLVGRGVLRKGFARVLWSLHEEVTDGGAKPVEMEMAMFEEILERIGVTIPLPVDENADLIAPPSEGIKPPEGSVQDSADLLVIMRLPLTADEETRKNLMLARRAAFPDSGGRSSSVKAVVEFDHAGAPHGLPERVMALSHKIGVFSPRARWRLGGLFLFHAHGVSGASSMILEYDKKSKTFGIEALGQSTAHVQAVQFVISALYHVGRDFPGASWTGWMECGMNHDGEKMYLLATSNENTNQSPGSEIVPLTRSSQNNQGRAQQNMCGMQGLDPRGSCSVDPDVFGTVLDVTRAFKISEASKARFGDLEGRSTNPDPPTASQRLIQIADDVTKLTKTVGRVEGGIDRVEEGMGRVEGGIDRVHEDMQKMDQDIQRIARRTHESLMRLKNLQAPNHPYPHLVDVKEVSAEGKRSLWSLPRRDGFVLDMRLHFLCPFDMSKVPCGYGGNGYRLRKTRGWVKKISPALQVTAVAAKVALRVLTGLDIPGLSGFLQDVGTGLAEELVDRTLDEDVLLRVLSGEEDAGAEDAVVSIQRKTRASYEAITKFMGKEEFKRRHIPRGRDGYVDFRDCMQQVHDEKGGLVWVRNENVQRWKDSLPAAAPST